MEMMLEDDVHPGTAEPPEKRLPISDKSGCAEDYSSGVKNSHPSGLGMFAALVCALLLAGACTRETPAERERREESYEELKRTLVVTKHARRLLKSLSTAQTKTELGMEQVRVFGNLGGRLGAGAPEAVAVQGEKGTYRVRVPFWCEGIRPDGRVARSRCHADVTLDLLSDETVRIVSPLALHADGHLSVRKQFSAWLGITLLGLFLSFLVSGLLVYMACEDEGTAFVAGVIVTWCLLLPLSGYFAFLSFGSGLAVGVCLTSLSPFYIWVTALTFGADWARDASVTGWICLVWLMMFPVAGVLLWKVVPYVVRGTWGWFDWLFGHF